MKSVRAWTISTHRDPANGPSGQFLSGLGGVRAQEDVGLQAC